VDEEAGAPDLSHLEIGEGAYPDDISDGTASLDPGDESITFFGR